MTSDANHCSFVLLAEFDIDRGAMLTYQFPQPLGTDELLLANLMLPDGAEKQLEDWTIFFLNQTPFNTISPVLALETPEPNGHENTGDGENSELLYVLNLVRTKHDKSVRRGAVVKAMAICTRHPFIQIFKPVLLMALDDYFSDPSQDCLARLFDAINSMDLTAAPILTRQEKIVMRCSERKDIFAEKFAHQKGSGDQHQSGMNWNTGAFKPQHRSTNSGESNASFDEAILMRNRDREREREQNANRDRDWDQSQTSLRGRERAGTESSHSTSSHRQRSQSHSQNHSPTESSFTLGGSAVWVGDDSSNDATTAVGGVSSSAASSTGSNTLPVTRGRRSTDASSASSHLGTAVMTPPYDPQLRPGMAKDTHFYHTFITYKEHHLPIKMPLSTFPEEVGDYSLITLIQAFPSAQAVSGPLHPHLHTNGTMTHPIIILFNALVTGKKIIFLGYNRPAGQVSSYVLSACALGSGSGVVLRGFIERAFPYANLTNRDEWESVPAYIAGVTNPIFEVSGSWDLLFDVSSGRVIVSKDINNTFPPNSNAGQPGGSLLGTPKIEGSLSHEDDIGRVPAREGKDAGQKNEFVAKADCADNLFIEDISAAIAFHFGEGLVRTRFMEYVSRFVRLAARYEEDTYGSTKLSYPSVSFSIGMPPQLGSGILFGDEATCAREMSTNASRIEGWRKTNSYQHCLMDFGKYQAAKAIKGVDVVHQLFRLRHTKNMPDAEVELIMRMLAENLQSYDQVVELLACLTPLGGGLLYLSFGLFHQQESIRELTVDIFNELRAYPVGVLFLQGLNHFQRYAYVRQAHEREQRVAKEQQQQQQQQQPQPQQPPAPPPPLPQQQQQQQQQHLLQPPIIPRNRSEPNLGVSG